MTNKLIIVCHYYHFPSRYCYLSPAFSPFISHPPPPSPIISHSAAFSLPAFHYFGSLTLHLSLPSCLKDFSLANHKNARLATSTENATFNWSGFHRTIPQSLRELVAVPADIGHGAAYTPDRLPITHRSRIHADF